jgi:DNA-binding MarR family transcriptional regulator
VDFLRQALRLSHSGCVRPVDKLQSAALVERQETLDKRAVALHLTALGQRQMQSVLRARHQCLDSVLQALDDRQKRHLTRLLESMLATLTRDDVHAESICRWCEEMVCPQATCLATRAVAK